MQFETEEQQVEALKKWWNENGKQVLLGVALGLGALGGWKFYVDHQQGQAEYASDLYEQALVADDKESGEKADVNQIVEKLNSNYSNTPYAAVTELVAAKKNYQAGDVETALQNLSWVIDNAKAEDLKIIARERKARILIEATRFDEALVLLEQNVPESFIAIFEELKGDVYVAKGDKTKARIAYDKALQSIGSSGKSWLQLKRDDLGKTDILEPAA